MMVSYPATMPPYSGQSIMSPLIKLTTNYATIGRKKAGITNDQLRHLNDHLRHL